MVDLNDDVLLNILHFCDLSTILTFGGACKKFHELLLEREVWAAAIRNLYNRGFIDLYPGQTIDQLSRDDLISLAKRTHRGPTTWKKDSKPEVIQSYAIKLDGPSGASEGDNCQQAILVPGGQYVVFRSHKGDQLACWKLASKTVIWTHKPPRESYFYRGMAADIVQTNDGPVIDILAGLRCLIHVGLPRKNLIEYIRLNPRTKQEEIVFTEEVADTAHDWPFGALILSGDYGISYVGEKELTIYNRTTQTFTRHYLTPHLPMARHEIGLAKGHLVIMTRSRTSTNFTLKLYDLEALQQQALAIKIVLEVDVPSAQWRVPIELFSEDLGISLRDQYRQYQNRFIYYQTSCHASPLRENVWCIWILIADTGFRPPYYGRLQKYYIEYADDGSISSIEPALSIGPIMERMLPTWTKGITWAGFLQQNYAEENRLYMFAEMGQPLINLCLPVSGVRDHISLSSYSGAVTYAAETEVVVNHYK